MMMSRLVFAVVLLAAIAAAQNRPVGKPAARVRPAGPTTSSQPQAAAATTGQVQKKVVAEPRRRDPFISIIQTRTVTGPACATGKRCLVINQLLLKGIAQSPDGMLALVENGQRKSYFLRENDPVFNGVVIRINRDSIVFREKVVDKLGREVKRDVVKTLGNGKPA